MPTVTIKMLAKELNLSTAAISKALRDSHEISSHTKERVLALAREWNYTPHPYAGSLRRKKSKTIAVVIPEVADSFFSLALNGIEAVALEKGYHALIYLTHEKLAREQAILKDLEGGRVDGVIMSVTSETDSYEHILNLNSQVPLIFFDRVCEQIDTAKITNNDYESGYEATKHLIECGCKNLALLSISNSLSISSKRLEGYMQALLDYNLDESSQVIQCSNNVSENSKLLTTIMSSANRPDGIVATVEKLTTEVYLVCEALKIKIPDDLKLVCFSNLSTAAILNPSLTTITQRGFEMGKAGGTILFKSLDRKLYDLDDENLVIPSTLVVRNSTLFK